MINSNSKIKNLDELAVIIQNLKAVGKVVAHCHGVFDLMHLGHIKHFEAARRMADVLVVTITQDQFVNKGPGRPVFGENFRAETIASLECVDYVAVNQWALPVETIKKLKPNYYVKGGEYKEEMKNPSHDINKDYEAIKSVGGEIYFTEEPVFSSSNLLNSHFNIYPENVRKFLEEFRKKYSFGDIAQRLKEIKFKKVLAVGDTVIDEYHFCRPLGKSEKENLVVMKHVYEESYAGGILALVNHLSAFCDNVQLTTFLGSKDSKIDFIVRNLKSNISTNFFYRDDTSTVIKKRFLDSAFLHKLFEVYYFEEGNSFLPVQLADQIKNYLKNIIADYDLVVALDYDHGFLNQEIINLLCSSARFLAVNTQTNGTNFGFNLVTKYPRVDYVCIDEQELRLATHQRYTPIEDLIREVSIKLKANRVVVTHGHHGSVAYSNIEGFFYTPIFSNKVVDSVGAGDAFLAITAPCVAAGMPMDLVGFIGNMAGALQVQTVGNKTSVDADSLLKAISVILK